MILSKFLHLRQYKVIPTCQKQEKVISLCHKYKNLWSHFEGRKPYDATKGLELKIDIVNPHTPPVKQRPRIRNELQQRSLQSQILDWEAAGKVKQY